jgi:hypothetical protein
MSSTKAVGTRPATAAPVEAAPDEGPEGQGAAETPEVEEPAGDVTVGYTGAADPNLEMLALEVLARMSRGKASEVSIEGAHERKREALEKVRELEAKIEKAQEQAKKWGEIGTAFKVGAIVAGGIATVATAGSAAPVVLFALGAAMKMTSMYGDKIGIKDKTLKTGLDIGGGALTLGSGLATSAAGSAASTAAAQASQTAAQTAQTAAEAAQTACTVGEGGATIAQTQYEGDVHDGHADTTVENNRAEDADLVVDDGFEQLGTQRKQSGQSVRAHADEAQRAHESDVRIIQLILGA